MKLDRSKEVCVCSMHSARIESRRPHSEPAVELSLEGGGNFWLLQRKIRQALLGVSSSVLESLFALSLDLSTRPWSSLASNIHIN